MLANFAGPLWTRIIYLNGNGVICLFKVDILRLFMMFEFPAYEIKQVEKRDLFWCNHFWDNAPRRRGKFKHHEYSENVKFEETNDIDSILDVLKKKVKHGQKWGILTYGDLNLIGSNVYFEHFDNQILRHSLSLKKWLYSMEKTCFIFNS